jgi:hypothetical protein
MAININTPFGQALQSVGPQYGANPFDIAAALGNGNVENGLMTSGKPGDNGTAFGGMQWRLDRADKLKALAASMGKDWTDPTVQATHWWQEHKNQGLMGATSVGDANDNAIDSLRPAGWSARAGDNLHAAGYEKRLLGSAQAYAALTGGAPDGVDTNTNEAYGNNGADPRQFQANAAPDASSQAQPVDPTSDANGYNFRTHGMQLAAALMSRDDPTGAAVFNSMLSADRAAAVAKKKDDTWTTAKEPVQLADGSYVYRKTNDRTGQVVDTPVPPGHEPKKEDPSDATPTRQEVQAADLQSKAVQNLGQLTPVRDAVNTLRDALQKGTFTVGPDKTGKMVIDNITGNSDENDRYLKSMQSNIINAASVVAQSQKGSMTNFKFAKDIEQVMPSFANMDPKAAYEALTRVSEGITGAYNGNANTVIKHAKLFPRLNEVMDPDTGEMVPMTEYYQNKVKAYGDHEKAMRDATPAFMASPGRSAKPTPKPGGLFDHIMGN